MGVAELVEQPREATVLNGEAVAAGLVAQGTGDPGFSHAGRPRDQQVELLFDSLPGDKSIHQRLVQSARVPIVQVLDDGALAQPGVAQAVLEPALGAEGGLPIEQ